MHRDGRYGPCRSLSPPIVKQNDYKRCAGRCQVARGLFGKLEKLVRAADEKLVRAADA